MPKMPAGYLLLLPEMCGQRTPLLADADPLEFFGSTDSQRIFGRRKFAFLDEYIMF